MSNNSWSGAVFLLLLVDFAPGAREVPGKGSQHLWSAAQAAEPPSPLGLSLAASASCLWHELFVCKIFALLVSRVSGREVTIFDGEKRKHLLGRLIGAWKFQK